MQTTDFQGTGINWDALSERMALNVREMGHPFHHQMRSGKVIRSDPRIDPDELDDSVLEHLWHAGVPTSIIPQPQAHPKRAVHAVSNWYDTEAGRRWLKKHSTGQVVQAAPSQQPTLWG